MELTLGMYESYGNDYLVYDCVKNEYELKPEDVRNICNRRFGAGADGILVGPVQMFGKMGVKITIRTEARQQSVETDSVFLQSI